jgi:hypothetical protein
MVCRLAGTTAGLSAAGSSRADGLALVVTSGSREASALSVKESAFHIRFAGSRSVDAPPHTARSKRDGGPAATNYSEGPCRQDESTVAFTGRSCACLP